MQRTAPLRHSTSPVARDVPAGSPADPSPVIPVPNEREAVEPLFARMGRGAGRRGVDRVRWMSPFPGQGVLIQPRP